MKFYMEEEKQTRELKIKRNITISISLISILSLITLILLYIFNIQFRSIIDINILRKNISTDEVPTIDLDANKSNQICVYSKYIAILNDKKISLYNNYGDFVSDFSVDINNAIFASANKYLAIAEYEGKNFYVFLDNTYLWSGVIEGEIKQIYVNANGYVAIVTTDVTYKSIITLYDQEGKSIIKKYLSFTRVIDVGISKDNKYLAIAELDTSGTLIQSNIDIISVENTINDVDKSIVYSYNADKGKLITKIKYQDKNRLVCMYDDNVQVINENYQIEDVFKKHNNTTYMSVNLNSNFVYIEEEIKGLFKANSVIHICNNQGGSVNTYNLEEVAKDIYSADNVIAVNVGLETYFINNNGWLIKKVSSNQEITNICFSGGLAGIVYKDKIDIIDF